MSSGRRGVKQGTPARSRSPVNPATSVIHTPAMAARCSPSRVLCSKIVEVNPGEFAQIVVGQVQVTGFGGHDGLARRRQRRVPYRQRLVVGEVTCLLAVGERVRPQLHGEDQVGLLDHLFAVQVEVGEVQQQRVLVRGRADEVPCVVTGEALGLAGGSPALRRTG